MKSTNKKSIAERTMVLAGVVIVAVAILQGVLISLILKEDFRKWSVRRMESVVATTLNEIDAIQHRINEDLTLIMADPALQTYFTAKAFEDYGGMTESVSTFEIYLKQVFRSKPAYQSVQLAGADGTPILQLNDGERVEQFDHFFEATNHQTTYEALFGARIPGQTPLVRTFSFQDDTGKWLVLTVAALAYGQQPEGLLWISKEIEDTLMEIKLGLVASQTSCAIVDRSGRLIIASDELKGERLTGFLDGRLRSWQIVESRIPEFDWVIRVGMPESILFGLLNKAIMVWLFATGVAVAAAMVALWVLKRHQQNLEEEVARQNRELVDSNQQLSETLASLEEAKEELTVINDQISGDRSKLQAALDEIFALIRKVTEEKKFGVYFTPAHVKTCREATDCTNTACVCYDAPGTRCWETVGSYRQANDAECRQCPNNSQGCDQCTFYTEATADPIFRIGEAFNDMMRILQGKNEELEQANAELKLSQSRTLQQEKMASIGQLAAGVAHEINNPIGFVSSNLGTMRRYAERMVDYVEELSTMVRTSPSGAGIVDGLDRLRKQYKVEPIIGDLRSLISESLEGTERVREIVANLKSFSRVDQAVEQEVDIHECLDSTINIVWNEIKYKAELRREYGQVPLLRCYPQQLNQVFMNLLINAAQAITGNKGVITVRTWEEKQSILIAITDTGQGIPAENLAHLFEPFFTTKEVGKGTGLGLSIAYDIITKQHKGEITAQSLPGQGSTFTIRLPLGA